jgi:glutaredoxin 3
VFFTNVFTIAPLLMPETLTTPRIQMYTTRWCGYCVRAKTLLDARQLPYEEINLDEDPAFRQTIHDLTGGWTVPQILIDGRPIGGYTELWRLDRDGRLDALLAA